MSTQFGYYLECCYIYEIEVEDEDEDEDEVKPVMNSLYATYSATEFIVRDIHTITGYELPFPPKLKINKIYKGHINYYKIKEIPRDQSLIKSNRSLYSPLYSRLFMLNYRNLALYKNGYTNIVKIYRSDGILHTQFFVNNNKIEGKYIEYHRDGITKHLEVDFVDGQINGEYKIFSSDNICFSTELYKNGELYEINQYYLDGNLKFKTQYEYKEKHGLEYEYIYNNIVTIIPYNCGKIDGDKIKFWPNRKLRFKIQYKNGKRDGEHIEYDENENVKVITQYYNNKKI